MHKMKNEKIIILGHAFKKQIMYFILPWQEKKFNMPNLTNKILESYKICNLVLCQSKIRHIKFTQRS